MLDAASLVRTLVLLLLVALTVILITRRLAVPYTLGLVVVGLFIGLSGLIENVHLTPDVVLFVFLPPLLFEGAWSISLPHLRANWRPILLLSIPGLILELILIAIPLHFLTGLTWADAFLLASILSPTDPVAVLGLFRQLKVDHNLSTIIEGESLFNDGVAGSLYQIFLALVLFSVRGGTPYGGNIWLQSLAILFLQGGVGVLIGIACGFLISLFVKYIDEPLIETTITIVVAYGVYLLADFFHSSGILAVIITGLIMSYYGEGEGMSDRTKEVVDNFWSMVAFLANALLFLLVGVQLNPLTLLHSNNIAQFFLIAVVAIICVLLARLIMVVLLPRFSLEVEKRLHSWRFIIFWSGLRGALSLALVLALPLDIPGRNKLTFATYAVILFTLLVQGFSLRIVLRHVPTATR